MRIVCLIAVMALFFFCSYGQADSTLNALSNIPNRLFAKLNSKASRLDDQLTRQTGKYLERMSRKERILQEKLSKTDSNAAKQLFAGSQDKYRQLENQLKATQNGNTGSFQGEYLANIDSVKTSLNFLQQNQSFLGSSSKTQALLNTSQQFNQLQGKLHQVDQIREYVRQRREALKNALINRMQTLGLKKYMDAYTQQVYSFSEDIRSY